MTFKAQDCRLFADNAQRAHRKVNKKNQTNIFSRVWNQIERTPFSISSMFDISVWMWLSTPRGFNLNKMTYYRRHFEMYFVETKHLYSDSNLTEVTVLKWVGYDDSTIVDFSTSRMSLGVIFFINIYTDESRPHLWDMGVKGTQINLTI